MSYFLRRHAPWVSMSAVGLLLVAAGLLFLVMGFDTHDQIREELRAEMVVTSDDAAVPGVLVDDAETARAQADVIKEHTLGTWGPYSELARDDPRRAGFIDGVALRTALNMAVMGFGLAEIAIAGGFIILIAGIATLLFMVPALFFLAGMVIAQSGAKGPDPGRG